MPSVAVVVCSRDRPEQLRRCLAALTGQGADELLVVDSASTGAGTGEVARAAEVRAIRLPEPGLARARNAGVRATTSDVIAFTDDDCRPDPGWVAAVRHAAASSVGVGVVLGRVVADGDGPAVSVQLATVRRSLRHGDDPSDVGHGANLAVTRACWTALDGFDERLGTGAALRAGEDTDLVWRALQSGFTGCFEPTAVVSHRQWRGRVAVLRTSYGYGVGAGAVHTKVRRLAGRSASRRIVAGSLTATLRRLVLDLRHRYAFGVLVDITRAAGVVVGRIRAARRPLDHGHLGDR